MHRILKIIKKHALAFVIGLIFAVLCFVGLNAAMVPVSKSDYCGSSCHEMNTAYQSWELSVHGSNRYGIRVECVDCHLPPKDEYFRHMTAKAYAGAKDAYKHYFGGEYDVEEKRKQVLAHIPARRCLNCHDDLLGKPINSAARSAHTAILNGADSAEYKCVRCHEDVGHQRQSKLFSP